MALENPPALSELTEEQKIQEKWKCKHNIIYFLENYCRVLYGKKGKVPFKPFEFQKEHVIKPALKHRFTIFLKGRQMGFSTTMAACVSHLLGFFPNKLVVVLSYNQGAADELLEKVKMTLSEVPEWLIPKLVIDNVHSKRWENGSRLLSLAATVKNARRFSCDWLIFDEAGFIDKIHDMWVAAKPTLDVTEGKCSFISTPSQVGTHFYKTYMEASNVGGKNSFHAEKLPWYYHPDKNEKWKENELKDMTEDDFRVEHECEFVVDGTSIIPANVRKYYADNFVCEPIAKYEIDDSVWVWEHPQPDVLYMVISDTSRGDGSDKDTFHVIKMADYEQVAEFQGQWHTDDFGQLLVKYAKYYNDAILIVENNNPGPAVLQEVIHTGYQNIYVDDKEKIMIAADTKSMAEFTQLYGGKYPGFSTNTATRPLVTAKFKVDICKFRLAFHSQRLATELDTWVWKNGRPDHMDGFHDDLIMAFCIASFVREKVYLMALELNEYIKAKPSLIHITNTSYQITNDHTREAYNEKGHQIQSEDIFSSVDNRRPR